MSKNTQKRFHGFLKTAVLWNEDNVYELKQFEILPKSAQFNFTIDSKLRLGKYIERFVSYQLKQETNIEVLCENVQIQQNKRTLGELDCIILKDEKPIHLEIIYKFYLFNDSIGTSEIEHFIGPNRKDSLLEKLTKLKEKQLPLLYSPECIDYLKTINLDINKIEQQVYFKAQLFVPYSNKNVQLTILNQDCIVGYYINKKELEHFYGCKFYILNKKDWLLTPSKNVNWVNFREFKIEIHEYYNRSFSPLCWIKNQNGIIDKVFIIWW